MSDKLFKVPADWAKNSYVNQSSYEAKYKESVNNNEKFWADEGKRIHWFKPYTKIKEVIYSTKKVSIKWFHDGTTNVSYNCIDRHLPKRAKQTAIIFEGDDPKESKNITYQELSDEVCKLANGLKEIGIKKGDRVTIYMPMVPEGVYAMLACTRIGAIHSVVFGGFSPDSIVNRILDCKSEFVITADEGLRGQKVIPLKKNIDEALKKCPDVKKCIVLKRTGGNVPFDSKRDVWYHELTSKMSTTCKPEEMNAEDPLFILYTSGSTGKPKGVLHTTGGYLVYASMTHQYIFDYKDGDIYWCTADIGWVTGHSYIVYGPLSNGATTLVFEGVPSYPDASRFWQVIDKHKVNIFYTAPTALRALMREGDAMVKKTSRKSLKLLGSVGEPINPEAWIWYHKVVGDSRCPIVDTWWQTETGGVMISNMADITPGIPSVASLPMPGILPVIMDEKGEEITTPEASGNLCIKQPWPGIIRTTYGDHERCRTTYFTAYPNLYFTGDGATRDAIGNYRITGRVDDVLNVSGHRIGTAEVENAINMHAGVIESAVVGFPHDIKGQGIYAYVIYAEGAHDHNLVRQDILQTVSRLIGAIAKPDTIQFVSGLPKTRSGKIMRRILRKIAEGETQNLGDTTTLLDPGVVEEILQGKGK